MPYFATINLRIVLRLVSILVSRAYRSIPIICGGGGIPPRLVHARTAETRLFLLLFGPGKEANADLAQCSHAGYISVRLAIIYVPLHMISTCAY